MILLEVVDAERRNEKEASTSTINPLTREVQASSRPSTSSNIGLPDYATSQAQAVRRGTSVEKEIYEKPTSKKSGDKKFRRVIVIALAAYFVISIAIGVPLFFVLRRKEKSANGRNTGLQAWSSNMGGYPPPPATYQLPLDISLIPYMNETPVECNSWSFVPASGLGSQHYSLQYSFPANETIYVHSNLSNDIQANSIPPISGMFHVGISQNSSQEDASISVSASDISNQALQGLSVCMLRLDCGWGLGIYFPNDTNVENAYFNVDLTLPQPTNSQHLGGLVTSLPTFNQSFESLNTYNYLESFIVQGSVGSITAEYVQAEIILVKSLASEVTGTFNTSNTIILESMLAPITANVSLHNDAQAHHPPTIMQVATGNDDISLNVSLHSDSTDPDDYPPSFANSIKTVSGTVQAAFRHDSSLHASTLQVGARTNYKPAIIYVDNVYQGTFDVNTLLGSADFDASPGAVDPSGQNRNHTIDYDFQSGGRLYGWVGWGERVYGGSDYDAQGHISVATSMEDASLQLSDVPNLQSAFVNPVVLTKKDVCAQQP